MRTKDFQKWKDRLSVANSKFKDMEKNINRWRNYYVGNQWDSKSAESYTDYTIDNVIFSNIQTVKSSLDLRNPHLYVTPKKKPYHTENGILFDTYVGATLLEFLLNYYYRELDVQRSLGKCLMDALIGPWGIIQIGYTTETEKVNEADEDEQLEVNELIKKDSIFVVRRSPLDLRIDPECKSSLLEDANWIALKWVKSLEDVKKNSSYKNTSNLNSNYEIKDLQRKDYFKTSESKDLAGTDDWNRVEGWDIWDKKTYRLITIVENHDKELQDRDWPLKFDGFPIETLYFNENPDELYPVSDVDICIPIQDELNRTRSLLHNYIKNMAQRKYASQQGTIDDEEKRKLTHGPDGTIIDVKADPQTALMPIRDDSSKLQMIDITASKLRDILKWQAGSSQMAAMAGQYETAKEAMLASESISTFRSERTEIVEEFISRVAKKMGQALQQTIDNQEITLPDSMFELAKQRTPHKIERIVGKDGMEYLAPWIKMSQEEIQGDYDFNIDVGSIQKDTEKSRRQDIMALLNILKGNPYMKVLEVTREVLKVFGRFDHDKLLKSEQEVQQAQQGAMQSQIQAEIAKDMPKRQTDLTKTKMKTEANILATMIKERNDE